MRQDPADGLDAPVEGELPEEEDPLQRFERNAPKRGERGGGDREIEPAPRLAQIRRREVDDDPVLPEIDAELRKRALYADATLPNGGFGEADQLEGGDVALDIDLDANGMGIEADERGGLRGSEHAERDCDWRAGEGTCGEARFSWVRRDRAGDTDGNGGGRCHTVPNRSPSLRAGAGLPTPHRRCTSDPMTARVVNAIDEGGTTLDPALARDLLALEERLLQLEARSVRAEIGALLDEGFLEIGKSGRLYHCDTVIAALEREGEGSRARRFRPIADFRAKLLGPGMVLATYRVAEEQASGAPPVESLRSSIWRFHEERWRLVFHQGTPVGR